MPNGSYNVTVSTGWQGRTYKRNYINIEGVDFINDEATDPYLLRTREVSVQDGKLSMAMGIFDEYTMLNYMDIETLAPVNSKPVLNIQTQDEAVSLSWNAIPGALSYTLYYAPLTQTPIETWNMGVQTQLSINLWSGAAFYVAVQANLSHGPGEFSDIGLLQIP
ncbi:Uncharacterised protein [Candidatus Venteria ishoeyi]|uniref:Fibronectin type-III domain-containing protein n=1 Tax=Candidatus Venteria ishoeyi TaxID=1899563 RepID=A0A1H6FEG9_9GAMM|nr:Uncharacterised protein [Candidatus Venteria ishoeyi]